MPLAQPDAVVPYVTVVHKQAGVLAPNKDDDCVFDCGGSRVEKKAPLHLVKMAGRSQNV